MPCDLEEAIAEDFPALGGPADEDWCYLKYYLSSSYLSVLGNLNEGIK